MISKKISPLITLILLASFQWSCSGGGGGENTANLSPQVTISYPRDNSSVVGNAVYSLKFSEAVTGLTGNNLNAACEGSIQLSPDNGGNCYPISIKSTDNISWTVDPVGELSDGAYSLTVTTGIQNLSALSPASSTSVTFNVKDALSTVANQLESDLIKADLSKDLAEAAKAGARTAAGSEKNDLLNVIPAAFDGAFDAVATAGLNENLTQAALSTIIESLLSNVAGQASLVSDHSAARVAVLPPNFSSLLKSLTTRVATKSASSSTTLQTLATALVSSLPAAGATATEIETIYVRSIVQTTTTVVMTTNTDKTARDSVLVGLGAGVIAGAKRITEMTVNVDMIQTTTTESMTAAANSSDEEYDVSTATTAIVTAVNAETPTSIVDESAPASCSLNGQTVAHGSTVTAYQASSVAFGNTCTGETRSCSDGTLSGAYTNTSCTVAAAASCSLNGQTVAHGSTVTAYQASSVAFGNTCTGETRSCSDGNLSGSYDYTSCTVNPASQSSSEYSADRTTFKITVSSSGYSNKYYVDGTETKSLSLKEGYTYYFNVEDSSTNNHPLFIGTTLGGGNYSNEYSSGVTGTRATNGFLTFTVPNDAPSTLYYNCGLHSSMGGVINIVESNSVSTPTSPAIDTNRCTTIKNSIVDAGFGSEVTVSCDNNHAYLASDTYPSHDLMNGITATNEQTAVPAKDYTSPIALSSSPITSESFTTRDAALGVAVNGVPIYDYSSGGELNISNWSYDSKEDTHALGQLDNCGGHSGRGDDYHYHKKPTCMINQMANKDANPIIGWAFDGYPIYGDNAPDGSPVSTLGLCNHTTDDNFGYRYHTSPSAPYILMCLVGVTDSSKLETVRVSPLPGRTSGRPINVTNLNFQANTNTKTLSYKYGNADYYIRYTPTGNDCYNFESKTVEDGGAVKTSTYCR